jgi:hypothetical protein
LFGTAPQKFGQLALFRSARTLLCRYAMSRRVGQPGNSNEVGAPTQPLDHPAGSHGDTTSSMLTAPVKSDGNEDLSTTQPTPAAPTNLREALLAAPVVAGSFLTSEPDPSGPSPNDPTRTTAPGAATMPGLDRTTIYDASVPRGLATPNATRSSASTAAAVSAAYPALTTTTSVATSR